MSDSVDLYWIPLGAGGHFVRLNGRAYEAIDALIQRRPRHDLYHSALVVVSRGSLFVIEQAPVRNNLPERRGVVSEGPVGARWAGRLWLFRYEIRCWADGVIPDVGYAVASPVRLSTDEQPAREILELMPLVPMFVWGRDELRTGDMWNSNSVISWLLARCGGIDVLAIKAPPRGRAPGWDAGLEAARRGYAGVVERVGSSREPKSLLRGAAFSTDELSHRETS